MRHSLLAFFLLPLAHVSAQELRHLDTPGFRYACYDPFRERVVAASVGGYSLEWDGATWRQAADVGAPSGFCYVDRSDRRLHTIVQRSGSSGTQLEHYVRVDHRWLRVFPTAVPPLRNYFTLVYDQARDEVLGFGGYSTATMAPLGDTWVFDGATWTQRPVAGPTPRSLCAAAYDDVRQRIVLFGGTTVPFSPTLLNDTWEWNGSVWAQVVTPQSPPPRMLATMAHDPLRQRMVMVGSSWAGSPPAALWEYDGSTWSSSSPLPTQVGLDPRIVHDAARNETLLLGGDDAVGRHGRVYAWNGTSWATRQGFGWLPRHIFGCEVAPTTAGSGILMYGLRDSSLSLSDELWQFDGSSWQLVSAGGPGARSAAALWTMPSGTYLFGGSDLTGARGDLWRWSGTGWTQLTPLVQPSPRDSASVAVDPVSNTALLFGGQVNSAPTNQTWRFNGAQWQNLIGGPVPPPRYSAAMAHDPVRNRTVVHGGVGVQANWLTDTWEWNGTTWAQVITALVPPGSGRMTWDQVTARVVYFAGGPGSALPYEVWSFDGAGWTRRTMTGTAGSGNVLGSSLPRGVTAADGRVYVVDQTLGVLELQAMPAGATSIGQPCGPDPLRLTAASLPQPGNTSFGLEVLGAPANGPVAIAVADAPASLPFFGCTLLLAPNQATEFRTATATGFVLLDLPVPPIPTLVGMSFWFQAAALAPTSANGFTLSSGVRIDIGQ